MIIKINGKDSFDYKPLTHIFYYSYIFNSDSTNRWS